MLNKIIEFSVRNKLIIVLFTLGLILFGLYELKKLPIDAQPDITNNQVQVITVAPSYGALDIERLVTFPIEQATSNINGITETRSFSRFGLSLVTIVFDDATDVYWARQQVSERLQSVKEQIPQGIGMPELGPVSTGLGEIFQYVVRAKEGYEHRYNEMELRTIQDWVVRRQLLGTPGVAEVSSFGGKLKQYEIAINPKKLQSFNLTINNVFDALEQNNQNTGGAYIEQQESTLFIRSEGLVGSIPDIESIPVAETQAGAPVLLKDVADIREGFATRYGAMTFNNKGEVSGAIILMLKGENANEVVQQIKARLAEIEKTLPEGVLIEPFIDRAKMVNNTIGTVKTNLTEGALIVVFILVLFLGNFRAGFLVASVIPLSMLFAVIMMNLFGVGGNLMSLGALDFGLIVDGAVIIVEAVLHQLAHKKHFGLNNRLDTTAMDKEVTGAASKMVNSAVFGQIIILIVYLPIFSLEGIEGKMFKPMAQTVAFALVGAFILSLTYIPMMSAILLSRKKKTRANFADRAMAKVETLHRSLLVRALKFRKTIILVVLALFAGAVLILSRMGGEFIPSLEEGDFAVEMRILQGSNIEKTKEVTTKAASILLGNFPEVEKIVTKIGSAEIPTEPMPMDAGDMIIVLKPKSEWVSAKGFPELSEKMSKALHVIPGLTTGFQFPVQMRFNELMTGARQDVVCKIYGEDLDSLALYADQLAAIIAKVPGAQDLYVEPVVGVPQVAITFNRAALAQHHVTVAEANKIINMAFAGQSAGLVYEGERRFDLVVRLKDEQKRSLSDIRNLLIATASGVQVPLQQLAHIELKSSPNQIQRENTKRRIVVGFNVRGRDVQSIVEELQQKVGQGLHLPKAYTVAYGGAFENLNQAKARLGIAVPVSLVLIFLLLFFAFGSVKHSLLIYTAIPLSAIGGVYFLAFRDMPFSISAGVGFIALFGVAVLNGIVLISEFNRLKSTGMANTTRIVVSGTKTRLRPVLMTAFVASLGFLPMALSNGSGAEVQRPLATVVIGGLMLATFLTLFVLPILYVLFEHLQKPKLKWPKKAISLALLLTSGALASQGQELISLAEAIDLAKKQNLAVKNSQLNTAIQKRLTSSYLDIPQTEITGEYGKINALENDNLLSVSQRFSFPTVYARRKSLLDKKWLTATLEQQLTAAQVERDVSQIFYDLLLLDEKRKLLRYTDSLYTEFSEKASLRLAAGEANILEESTAKVQREQIAIQLDQLEKQVEVSQLQFALLLQTTGRYTPRSTSLTAEVPLMVDSSAALHPELGILREQVNVATANHRLEQSKFLPDIIVAYNNQSMKNVNNGRFSSVQVGIGIPIFTKSQHSVTEAAKIQVDLEKARLQKREVEQLTEMVQLRTQYRRQEAIVDSYRQKQLPAAAQILQTAKNQLNAGEINFLDWVILTNQAVAIQSQYIDALDLLNQYSISLQYLLSK